MKNNSGLDEHIANKFSDYSPDVPPHIWENIMAGKEKRRPLGWFSFLNKNSWLLLCVILTGSGLFLYNYFHSSKQNINIATNGQIKNTTATKDQKTTADEKITSAGNTSKNATQTGNIPSAGNTNTINSNETSPVKSAISTAGINAADDQLAIVSKDDEKYNATAKRSKNIHTKTSMVYHTPGVITDDIPAAVTGSTETSAGDDPPQKNLLLHFGLLQTEKTATLTIKKIAIPSFDIPCPTSEKNSAGNKKYIEIYGGPDYAFRSITDTGNSVYREKRNESSRFSSAFSVGMRYTKVFGNGMSFRTGVNYSQINEKFKYAQGNIIQIIYITNSNGDTTGSFISSGTRYKTTHNKFRTIDVPILIGYELGNSRLHVNFNAGAIINIYSWQKGDVLDTAYQPVNITTGKTSSPYQFKTNTGVGFLGSVSLYYKLTERLHFLAEPYFRYNFSPASKSDLTLRQKYSTAGLRVGLRLDF